VSSFLQGAWLTFRRSIQTYLVLLWWVLTATATPYPLVSYGLANGSVFGNVSPWCVRACCCIHCRVVTVRSDMLLSWAYSYRPVLLLSYLVDRWGAYEARLYMSRFVRFMFFAGPFFLTHRYCNVYDRLTGAVSLLDIDSGRGNSCWWQADTLALLCPWPTHGLNIDCHHFYKSHACSPLVIVSTELGRNHCINIQVKKKVKLSRCTLCRRLGGEEVQLLLILNLGTRRGWVVSVTPRPRLTPGERTPGTHWLGGWVGPEPIWTQGLEEKSSASVGDRTPVVQSVVRHNTDWATLYRVSHKCEAIGELCYLAKYGKMWRGISCCKWCVSDPKCWNFLSGTSRYGATRFTSVVKSYGDVATLSWQRNVDVFPGSGEAAVKETQVL
jgi:hypothetical protein